MLYLFAGKSRAGDIRDHLTRLQSHFKFVLNVDEYDWEQDPSHDLSKTELWDKIFRKVESGFYDVIMLSPPCGTFSRARHNRRSAGPRPIRSKDWPWGFPWLSATDMSKAQLANLFIKKSLQLASIQTPLKKFWLLEHPEDLGTSSECLATGGDADTY